MEESAEIWYELETEETHVTRVQILDDCSVVLEREYASGHTQPFELSGDEMRELFVKWAVVRCKVSLSESRKIEEAN